MNTRLVIALGLALSLVACDRFPGSAPEVVPTVVLNGGNAPAVTEATNASALQVSGGSAAASGVIVSAQEARLAAAMAGRIESVAVAAGDTVEAGQVLVTLAGGERLAAAVTAADLELLNARQAVQDLEDSATTAAAQAQLAVATAQANLDRAQRELKSQANPDVAYYQDQFNRASQALTAAEQNAQITEYQIGLRAAADALTNTTNALNNLKDLEARYPGYSDQHNNALGNAQIAYDRALQDFQAAQLRLQQALAADDTTVSDAQKAYNTAQANLAAAQRGPDAVKLALAQADVAVAEAALADAETLYVTLKDGPDPDALALAEARVTNAEAQSTAAKAALADLEIRAPFAGTIGVVSVNVGEWVTPGQPVIVLTDLSALEVETTDLSERDVPGLVIGQSATVTIDALGQTVSGHLVAIAPLAGTLGGDVVYKATIALDEQPASLRPGMSVGVSIQP